MSFFFDQLSNRVLSKSLLCIIFLLSFLDAQPPLRSEADYLYQLVHKYEFEHLTVDDGLSHNTIISIIQDHDGFMWFATWGGLNRFDGYKFTYFQSNSEDSSSLSHNAVSVIFEDKNSTLWAGTVGGGLNRFNREKLNFKTFTNPLDSLNSNLNHRINNIIQDTTGILWISTFDGIDKLDPVTNRYTGLYRNTENIVKNPGINYVEGLCLSKSNDIYFCTTDMNNTGQLVHYKLSDNSYDFINLAIEGTPTAIIEDRNGDFWLGSDNDGLLYVNPRTMEMKSYKHDPNNLQSIGNSIIECLYEDHEGKIWIGTRGTGISILDRKTDNFIHLTHSEQNPTSLSHDFVYSFYEDNSGILWIGTGGGVNKLNLERKKFVKLTHIPGSKSKKLDQVRSIVNDKTGTWWIASYGNGLIKYNPLKGDYKLFTHDANDPSGLPTNLLRYIYLDKYGEIWLETDNFGIVHFNEKTGKATTYRNRFGSPDEVLNNNSVNDIFEDSQGNFWIGTWLGLTKWHAGFREKEDFKVTHYLPDENDSTSISYEVINQIYEDRSGTIWISTKGGGLNRLIRKKDKDEFIAYKFDPHDSTSISHNELFFIYEDKAGNLWIGSNGGGLNRFNRDKQNFKRFKIPGESALNILLSALEDKQGNIWIGTKGLIKFDINTSEFTHYDEKQGLINDLFSFGAATFTQSGDMVFAGGAGINVFDPQKIKDNPYKPRKTVLTDFQLFNQSVPIGENNGRIIIDKSISELDTVILNHEVVITLEFSALHFSNPSKNKYMYKLVGFDKDWIYTNASRRYVTYTNLNPGQYTFKVKGSNNDGLWDDAGANLTIIIKPPFWSTWWFRFIVVFLITYGVIFIYQVRTRMIKARNIKLSHEIKVREKAETDLQQRLNFENIIAKISSRFVSVSGDILDIEIDKALKQLGQFIECESAFINLFSSGGEFGAIEYAWNLNKRHKELFNVRKNSRLSEYLLSFLSSNLPIVLNSLSDLPNYLKSVEKSLAQLGIRSMLISPMVVNNKLIGLLGFDNLKHHRKWSDSDINLIELTSSIFANAIERQNNINLMISSEEKLRSLTLYLQKIREEDRLSIAREMHDELGQILTAIKMDVIMMETNVKNRNEQSNNSALLDETEHIKKMIDSTIKNVRKLITELRPEVLDNLGLLEAIQWYIDEYEKRTGVTIKYQSNISHIEFDKDYNIAIYRIIQESFTNVSRHAEAKNITVDIERNNNKLSLKIVDDGIGFDPDKVKSKNHFGIIGMKERVHIFNGSLDIISKPGTGTTVLLGIPIN